MNTICVFWGNKPMSRKERDEIKQTVQRKWWIAYHQHRRLQSLTNQNTYHIKSQRQTHKTIKHFRTVKSFSSLVGLVSSGEFRNVRMIVCVCVCVQVRDYHLSFVIPCMTWKLIQFPNYVCTLDMTHWIRCYINIWLTNSLFYILLVLPIFISIWDFHHIYKPNGDSDSDVCSSVWVDMCVTPQLLTIYVCAYDMSKHFVW